MFSVSDYTYNKRCFFDGMEIETQELQTLKSKCQWDENYNYCLFLLSKNSYSKKVLFDKLIKKECSEEVANQVIEQLEKNHYISDENFKESFIINAQKHKKKGHRRIKQELYSKGISTQDEDFDMEEELSNLKTIVEELIKKNVEQKKIINRLLLRGYNFSDILNAIKQYEECDEDYDEY